MKKIAVLTLCLVGAALAVPTGAMAQCTTGTAHLNANDSWMVGDIPGGITKYVGQQFTVDCTAQLLDVTFRLTVDSNMTIGSQTCLSGSDLVACVLMDLNHNELARVERPLNFNSGTRDIVFDFSGQTYGLAPGDYIVTWESVTKSFLFFNKYNNGHTGFMHVYTDGTWAEDWFSDAYFAVNWDEAGVSNDQLTWGAMKADYR